MYKKALDRLHQSEYVGLKDMDGKTIKEGDILRAPSGFRYIVIWNEYINNFCILFVSCFKDMILHPYTRGTYLEDSNPICKEVIEFWHLNISDNLDKRPFLLSTPLVD